MDGLENLIILQEQLNSTLKYMSKLPVDNVPLVVFTSWIIHEFKTHFSSVG